MWFSSAALLMLSLAAHPAPLTADDAFLKDYAETGRFLFGRPVKPKITPDGKWVLFLRSLPRSPRQSLFAFEVATGQTIELLRPENLLAEGREELAAEEKARLERQRISARGFTHYDLSPDGNRVVVGLSGKLYLVDLSFQPGTGGHAAQAKLLPTGEGALDPRFSPDGRYLGFVRDHDVYAVHLQSLRVKRLTHSGTAEVPHGLAEFVAQEEMGRFEGYWFSPDSSLLAFQESDQRAMERFAIVDPMHPEAGAAVVPYPRVGKPNAKVKLLVVAFGAGTPVGVKWDREKYPYLATVKWPKKGPLTLVVQNRPQTEELVLSVNHQTGVTTQLLKEVDPAWINLDQEFPRWSEDGQSFLWRTERNGGPEIEERDAHGELKSRWVLPEAGLSHFTGWDEKAGLLYFVGSPEPTEQILYRVKKGGAPERVPLQFPGKTDPGWQDAGLSKDGKLLWITWTSPVAMPCTGVFRAADGTNLGTLPTVSVEPPFVPKLKFLEVGQNRIRGAVIFPSRYAPGKKLPVVVEVYGGPTHSVVTRQMRENLILQWLADQGFIVAKFDVSGTPRRGRNWARAMKGDFTAPLTEQVEALEAAASQIPEMDLNRVGVEGWSFGGYLAALSALKRGDVYKAAVAGAPVVDWRDYDTHYTERYLGVPEAGRVGEGSESKDPYRLSSLLTYAPELKSSLLLIHGTGDDNVYFFHSLKLSDALFKAGKPHEFLPLSGLTHMVPEPLVTQRLWMRIAEFFKQKL